MALACVHERGGKAATAPLSAPVFQVTELLRRCMGDRELAAALMERFTTRLGSSIHEIEGALAAGDRPRVASLAHNLKGEAGSMGAGQLQQAAAALEDCLQASRHDEAVGCLDRLKSTAQQCSAARAEALQHLCQAD